MLPIFILACTHCDAGESAGVTARDASQPEAQAQSNPANEGAVPGDEAGRDTGTDTRPSSDAATCPMIGLTSTTLGEQVAYECSQRWDAGPTHRDVWVSTNECDGLLGLLVQDGTDTQTLYLFDPVAMVMVEAAGGANGMNDCVASSTGYPQATSCTYVLGYAPPTPQPGHFAWRDACTGDGGLVDGGDASQGVDGASD